VSKQPDQQTHPLSASRIQRNVSQTGKTAKASKPASKPAGKPAFGGRGRAPLRAAESTPAPAQVGKGGGQTIIDTVAGLGYELVDVERLPRGLLRVTIDRVPGRVYTFGPAAEPQPGESITVEDCEAVTRQLQYALEVDGLAYARLEVSSPGLDRPLKTEADYARFSGQAVSIVLKTPFEGRKSWQGVLGKAPSKAEGTAGSEGEGWTLVFKNGKTEQVLGFTFPEVRDARLVPVVNFKGRPSRQDKDSGALKTEEAVAADAAPQVDGGK
jgi:ribosome maturation factor RimP